MKCHHIDVDIRYSSLGYCSSLGLIKSKSKSANSSISFFYTMKESINHAQSIKTYNTRLIYFHFRSSFRFGRSRSSPFRAIYAACQVATSASTTTAAAIVDDIDNEDRVLIFALHYAYHILVLIVIKLEDHFEENPPCMCG